MSSARPGSGVSQTTGAPAARTTATQGLRVDGPGGEVRVPVRARGELVARVVAVHQVDPAGDRLHPVDRVGQVDAGRVGVAGVQAEADLAAALGGRAHSVPEPGDRVKRAGHRAVAARGVLDQQRQRSLDLLHRLDPVRHPLGGIDVGGDVAAVHDQALRPDRGRRLELLVEQFSARNADAVVGRRHVDDVRRVDIDVHIGGGVGVPERGGVAAGEHRSLPPLRVAEEELRGPRTARDRVFERVIRVKVAADTHHALEGSAHPRWC